MRDSIGYTRRQIKQLVTPIAKSMLSYLTANKKRAEKLIAVSPNVAVSDINHIKAKETITGRIGNKEINSALTKNSSTCFMVVRNICVSILCDFISKGPNHSYYMVTD